MLFGDIELVIANREGESAFLDNVEAFSTGLSKALGGVSESFHITHCSWVETDPLESVLNSALDKFDAKLLKAGSYRRDSPVRVLVLLSGQNGVANAENIPRLHQILRKFAAQEIDGIVLGPGGPAKDLSEVPNWIQHLGNGPEEWCRHVLEYLEKTFKSRQMRRPEPEQRWYTGGFSSIGRRSNNEDAYALFNFDVNGLQGDLLVVCDGVGGSEAGEMASRTVIERLPVLLAEIVPFLRSGLQEQQNEIQESISDHVLDSCAALKRLEDESPGLTGFSTTLVGVLRYGNDVLVFWSGDSRCYRLRNGVLEILSWDHSVPMEKDGMNPDEAETAADKRITRFMSAETTQGPSFDLTTTQPGDVWLVCSDGITSAATTHHYLESYLILSMVHAFSPAEAVEAIIQSCWRTISDNSTAVVAIDAWPQLNIGDPDTSHVARQIAAASEIESSLLGAIQENAGKTYEEVRFPFENLSLKSRFSSPPKKPVGEMVLAVYGPNGESRMFPLKKEKLTIGRDKGSDIVLDDSCVASTHAVLEKDWRGRMKLISEDVDGGTWIQAGADQDNLKFGDTFRIGTYLFRIEAHAASA